MRVRYSESGTVRGSLMPRLILTLEYESYAIEINAIVDSGSAINLLTYQAGLALNAVWEEQDELPLLGGSLRNVEARSLNVMASHPELTPFEPIPLTFAWAKRDDVAILLGQTDFFQWFDVCFYNSRGYFEVNLRQDHQ